MPAAGSTTRTLSTAFKIEFELLDPLVGVVTPLGTRRALMWPVGGRPGPARAVTRRSQCVRIRATARVTAFVLRRGHLHRLGPPAPSGGTTPTSVTIHDDLVYVMNAGSGSIHGFRLDPGRGGPFGFDVDEHGHVLFSNVALGTSSGASSYDVYDVSRDGVLTENGSPVASGEWAACWLAAVGRYAYTTNAGSGSIGTITVAGDGSLIFTATTPIALEHMWRP